MPTPVTDIEIRNATDADCAPLAPLLEQLGYPTTAAEIAPRLKRFGIHGPAVALVAAKQGSVVGVATGHLMATIHAATEGAYLTTLVVSSEVRGQGIGRLLVEAIEAWAREHNCKRLIVTTALHRTETHKFYERLEFDFTGRRYVKKLSPAK
jgi:GNAT superfamily N-acetyltransferase